MIPTIKIDSRDYNEIFSEALSLVPRYCPEWTNLNTGDPGVTLISLFSWMMEASLSRVNLIPQKVYMALLDMLGFSIKPPQAANGIVRFVTDSALSDGKVVIRKGTRIGSIDLNAEGLLFVTNENLSLRNNSIAYCFNKDANKFREIRVSNGNIQPFSMFETENSVEYMLYFSSPAFESFADSSACIQIEFKPNIEVFSVKDEIISYFMWEYWNGESWVEVKPVRIIDGEKQRDNIIYFNGPFEDFAQNVVNGVQAFWLRAVLVDIPENPRALELLDIKLKVYSSKDGIILDDICRVSSGNTFKIDPREPFKLFKDKAAAGDCFYISNESLFSKTGVKLFMHYAYSSDYLLNPSSRNLNKYVDFSYEYFNGKKWVPFTKANSEFNDETNFFVDEGDVSFVVPKDLQKTNFNNKNSYWIRIRISPKNYAYGGDYIKSEKDKKISWDFDANILMPELEYISLKNAPFQENFENVISYENFSYNSLNYFITEHDGKQSNKIFNINSDINPGTYFGFANTVSKGQFNIFIKLNDSNKILKDDYLGNVFDYHYENQELMQNPVEIEWQMLTKSGWKECSVVDRTNNFSNSGFVEIMLKNDLEKQELFGKSAAWIRVLKRNGSFEISPYLENAVINCVSAVNSIEHNDELFNYSNLNTSLNRYNVTTGNLLKGIRIAVNEGRVPTNDEIKQLKAEGIETPYVVDGDKVWVEYKEVPNFYNSGVLSRHFVVNYTENAIYFGDGVNGVSPIASNFQMKFIQYFTGGGRVGNLAAHKLQYMTENYPHVVACDNPFPCEGGSDVETVEQLRARASGLLKSLDRAVTNNDFEWLARESSPAVARAHCVTNTDNPRDVKLIIVPRLNDRDYTKVTYPSRALMNTVKSYLDDRKIIGLNISIFPPYYRRFNINVDVIFSDSYFDRNAEKVKITEHLRKYYSALYGYSDGNGWPFSKNVTKSSITNEVGNIDSVIKVIKVDIFDVDRDAFVDELSIGASELPYLSDVNVYDKYI